MWKITKADFTTQNLPEHHPFKRQGRTYSTMRNKKTKSTQLKSTRAPLLVQAEVTSINFKTGNERLLQLLYKKIKIFQSRLFLKEKKKNQWTKEITRLETTKFFIFPLEEYGLAQFLFICCFVLFFLIKLERVGFPFYSSKWLSYCATICSAGSTTKCHKNLAHQKANTLKHTYHPSYSDGWDRRMASVQEPEASLGNIVRPPYQKRK
jgi:hypothetical protein